MSGTTFTNLKAEVRSYLDESSAKFFSDTEIARWINRGVRHLAEYITNFNDEFFTAVSGSISYTANTERIDLTEATALDATFNRIKRVEYLSGSATSSNQPCPIRYIPFNERPGGGGDVTVDDNASNRFYSLSGDYLYMRPIPQAAIPIRVHYIPDITELSSGDDTISGTNPAFPLASEEVVIAYAAKCGYIKAGTSNSELNELYQRLLRELKRSVIRRTTQQPRTVIYRIDEYYD